MKIIVILILTLVLAPYTNETVQVGKYLPEPITFKIELLNEARQPIKRFRTESINELSRIYANRIEPCTKNTFKSYMDYRKITSTTSEQYKLQKNAYTGKHGIRKVDDRMMVAMIGFNVRDKLDVTLENGQTLKVIIGDVKDAGHDNCQSTTDGSMIEFIVDGKHLNSDVRYHGNFNILFKGSIDFIEKKGS